MLSKKLAASSRAFGPIINLLVVADERAPSTAVACLH
jgi:hypothetical protein